MKEQVRLPDHVHDNIQAIASMSLEEERALSAQQRAVEKLTRLIGRPWTLYGLALTVLAWAGFNLWVGAASRQQFDAPPFFILQGVIGVYAALMTTMILVTQNRQSRDARRNAHLDLQVNMLAEQRTAKIVALLEELRRDMPNVRNRVDLVADALQQAIPPHVVSSVLDETLHGPLGAQPATSPVKSGDDN